MQKYRRENGQFAPVAHSNTYAFIIAVCLSKLRKMSPVDAMNGVLDRRDAINPFAICTSQQYVCIIRLQPRGRYWKIIHVNLGARAVTLSAMHNFAPERSGTDTENDSEPRSKQTFDINPLSAAHSDAVACQRPNGARRKLRVKTEVQTSAAQRANNGEKLLKYLMLIWFHFFFVPLADGRVSVPRNLFVLPLALRLVYSSHASQSAIFDQILSLLPFHKL